MRPRYAQDILSGKKKVELRRVRPRVQRGDLVVIYASSPVMAVLGIGFVSSVVTRAPGDLWPMVEHGACISREEFDAYFRGSKLSVALFLSGTRPLRKPLGLGEIREVWPEFRPPQGYRYLASMKHGADSFLNRIRVPAM